MAFDLDGRFAQHTDVTRHVLNATTDNCYWGYIDREKPACLEVNDGDIIEVEAVTHHAGDAPDLLTDDGIRALWSGIAESSRGPGVHIMTGPIHVRGAEPGDTLAVRIIDMVPRLAYGSNCAANWGLLYRTFGKERITIYGLDPSDDPSNEKGFSSTASAMFGFDFSARPVYDLPGVISDPATVTREPFSRPVHVPVRPHFGVMGVAPAEFGRRSSIPPSVFGGNVDSWRVGPGATMCYPVFVPGANLYVGDPHFAQGDGEICGTAIEASLNAVIQVSVIKGLAITSPLLETASHWYTHGFGADLDEAMTMAAEQMLWLMSEHFALSRDDAYSLASVAMDLGVTQVVDATLGCHAGIARNVLAYTT
jgi:acetamidase/formamidase